MNSCRNLRVPSLTSLPRSSKSLSRWPVKESGVVLFGRVPAVGADPLLVHLRLLCVVRSAESDMMHRPASLVPSQNSSGFVDVDHAAFRIPRGSEADYRSFTGDLAEAKHIGQDRCRLLRAVEKQRHAPQAADRMFGGDVLVAPARLILGIGDAGERERHPILIRERQHGLTEAFLQRLVGNSLLDETLSPVTD